MLQSFVALGVISVVWVLIGFSLTFGDSISGIIGSPLTYLNFKNVGLEPNPEFAPTISFLLFAFFQLKFAIITPAAEFVSIGQSVFIGFIAALICNWMIHLKNKSTVDDTLDVFPSHGVGGIVGMLLTGILASDVGLIYGEFTTFYFHIIALLRTTILTFGGSYLLFRIVDGLLKMRVSQSKEEEGLDRSQHGEEI